MKLLTNSMSKNCLQATDAEPAELEVLETALRRNEFLMIKYQNYKSPHNQIIVWALAEASKDILEETDTKQNDSKSTQLLASNIVVLCSFLSVRRMKQSRILSISDGKTLEI